MLPGLSVFTKVNNGEEGLAGDGTDPDMPGSPALEPHVLFLASSRRRKEPALGWADLPAETGTARTLLELA